MVTISSLSAHKILDSNGEWTIQTIITLSDGTRERASVPSGRSVGKYEAKLVSSDIAVTNINSTIANAVQGLDIADQTGLDQTLINLDGTKDKSNLGANTILAVSLCAMKAAAQSKGVELYQYINQRYEFGPISIEKFPTPLLNLINGGAHASNNLEFQSFMIAPATYMDYTKSLEMGVTVYHKLKEILKHKNLKTDVGEEGGFAPNAVDIEQTCHHIVEAIIASGIKAGTEMFLAIDAAASTFYVEPNYQTRGVLGAISADQLHELYISLVRNFPILYLEDPFAEDSWEDWTKLNAAIGSSVEIVGDDITVTNEGRLKKATEQKCITGVIIKPNQIGTFTETINVIKKAHSQDLTVIMSHRSGETAEDTFLADLAVGTGAHYIKAGAPARGERTVKYNRLLAIEQHLSSTISEKKDPLLQKKLGGLPMENITDTTNTLGNETPQPSNQAQTQPDPIASPAVPAEAAMPTPIVTPATPTITESEVEVPVSPVVQEPTPIDTPTAPSTPVVEPVDLTQPAPAQQPQPAATPAPQPTPVVAETSPEQPPTPAPVAIPTIPAEPTIEDAITTPSDNVETPATNQEPNEIPVTPQPPTPPTPTNV